MREQKAVTVYMCGVDWQHEVGHAADGNKVFPSPDSLKEYQKCWKSCGIVAVEMTGCKWVEPQDLMKGARKAVKRG